MVVDRYARSAKASRIVQGATTVALNRMVTPCLQSDGMAALSVVVPSE
jgi:hypothetical protein